MHAIRIYGLGLVPNPKKEHNPGYFLTALPGLE
jgi:hypothetical protein